MQPRTFANLYQTCIQLILTSTTLPPASTAPTSAEIFNSVSFVAPAPEHFEPTRWSTKYERCKMVAAKSCRKATCHQHIGISSRVQQPATKLALRHGTCKLKL